MKKYLKVSALLIAMLMTVSLFAVGCSQKAPQSNPAPQAQPEAKKEEPKPEAKKETDWPKKPIQVIVPFKAGGDTDFNARTYAKYLEEKLGQPVIIVNVDGNGGTLGSKKAKDAAPDGYTVLFYHAAMFINEATEMAKYGFKDFEMAGVAAMNPGDIITVDKSSKYQTLKDLVEDSKANPGKISITANTGATTYLTALMLKEAGAELNIVDLGGASDRIAGLKGGHVNVITNPYGTVKQYFENGDFRPLAVITEKRNSKFDTIPTALEQGYDVVQPIPYFFLFPKGTPKEIVDKFSTAVGDIAQNNKEYAEAIDKAYNQTPFFLNPEESTKYLNTLNDRVIKLKDQLMAK
ncbi:MAG: tripartite tricarboxylate transporter substrate binding protein [Clostridia bacterium]